MRLQRDSKMFSFLEALEDPSGKSGLMQMLSSGFHLCLATHGRRVFKKIEGNRDTKARYIVMPTASFGDLLLLRSAYDELSGDAEIILLAESRMKPAVIALNFPNVHYIGQLDRIALVAYEVFDHPDRLGNALPWLMFNAESEDDAFWDSHYPKMEHSASRVDELFEQGNLIPGNTVVLSPYEQSVRSNGCAQLPVRFWEMLAASLSEKGYCVCTNGKGDEHEPPIKGTTAVFPKLEDSAAFVSKAGLLISTMSGFVDFTAKTTAKSIALYPDEDFYAKWGGRFLSIREDFSEIIYEQYVTDDRLDDLERVVLEML